MGQPDREAEKADGDNTPENTFHQMLEGMGSPFTKAEGGIDHTRMGCQHYRLVNY